MLRTEDFRHYVEALNRSDSRGRQRRHSETLRPGRGCRTTSRSWRCPDSELELTYYYRWWAYRKHIEKTGAGYVITEFLRPVNHSTDYNAISCALGLHIAEGRWLHDPEIP